MIVPWAAGESRRTVIVDLPADHHRQLRLMAVEKERTMADLIREAVGLQRQCFWVIARFRCSTLYAIKDAPLMKRAVTKLAALHEAEAAETPVSNVLPIKGA
jgi:hypothetical protein